MEHWGFLDGNDNSFKLKPSVQTYELTLADLTKLFAQQLGVPEKRITIAERKRDVSGRMDDHSTYAFDGIIVSVKGDTSDGLTV